MSLTRVALLTAVGAVLAITLAHACDYSMRSDVTAEAPAAASPPPVAQATEPAQSATTAAATADTASAQTAKAETVSEQPRATN